MNQNIGENLGVLGCCPEPASDRFIPVACNLLGCGEAATPPHHQKGARNFAGWGMEAVHQDNTNGSVDQIIFKPWIFEQPRAWGANL